MLTPSVSGIHIPIQIYSYMKDKFFNYVCIAPGTQENNANSTSKAVPFANCMCDGSRFYGMPEIDFDLTVDQYETGYSYKLLPAEYEMSPKVDSTTQKQRCDLGLWSSNNTKS